MNRTEGLHAPDCVCYPCLKSGAPYPERIAHWETVTGRRWHTTPEVAAQDIMRASASARVRP